MDIVALFPEVIRIIASNSISLSIQNNILLRQLIINEPILVVRFHLIAQFIDSNILFFTFFLWFYKSFEFHWKIKDETYRNQRVCVIDI